MLHAQHKCQTHRVLTTAMHHSTYGGVCIATYTVLQSSMRPLNSGTSPHVHVMLAAVNSLLLLECTAVNKPSPTAANFNDGTAPEYTLQQVCAHKPRRTAQNHSSSDKLNQNGKTSTLSFRPSAASLMQSPHASKTSFPQITHVMPAWYTGLAWH